MQGFNMGRYVPPDAEGLVQSGNELHRPRRRAGPPTVRFEMPFAVWCESCPQPTLIGQGVRFNAEKRQTGSYHSTRIWTFRLRHAECGGVIEVRTDPRNTAYVVVSGARRRDGGEGERGRWEEEEGVGEDGSGSGSGQHALLTTEGRQRLRQDAFASLEKTIADREQLVIATRRVDELAALSARQWRDPAVRNARLRQGFRAVRVQCEREADEAEALRERMGLGLEIGPGTEGDSRRAALVDFGAAAGEDGGGDGAMLKPLFLPSRPDQGRRPKTEEQAALARRNLAAEVARNSRAARDPFLARAGGVSGAGVAGARARVKASPASSRPGKRKRDTGEGGDGDGSGDAPPPSSSQEPCPKAPRLPGLVDYDSD